MFQFVLSIILIASLLTCPLRCMSCQPVAASVNDCVPAGCSCCHCESELPVSDSSEDYPNDHCSCPNCICEGATLQDILELPDVNTQAASVGRWLLRIERDINVEMVQESAGAVQDWDRRNSGRGARIAHHSWLL